MHLIMKGKKHFELHTASKVICRAWKRNIYQTIHCKIAIGIWKLENVSNGEETILQVLYPEGEYMNSVNVAWKLYLLFSAVQTFRF